MTLLELNVRVRRGVRAALPDMYWVQAELSDVRSNYSGHCYMEMLQKDERSNALLAKARGVIWSGVYRRLRERFEQETGQAFVSGIKVLVYVKVDFHELYGYQLTVCDIDPTYTLGDMARRRMEIVRRLKEEGVFDLNRQLQLPELAQRIAVISSATAAGYEDFCRQLADNNCGFVFYPRLFPAVMQGDRVEESVIAALDRIYAVMDRFDVVVIIRGGGATSDLSGFDTYDLAANCAQFPLPVITGIGHERDDTVLDMVSHTRVKTPTAAAEFLIGHLGVTAGRLEGLCASICGGLPRIVDREKKRLEACVMRLPSAVRMRLQREAFRQERAARQMQMSWQVRLVREQNRLQLMTRIDAAVNRQILRERHRLELLEQKVKSASPELLLKRGYSITLKDGRAVTDPKQLKPGEEVTTRVSGGEFKSRVL